MKHIITLLVLALLMAGAADARVVKGQTKKKKATTTVTTKTKSKTKSRVRPAAQQILPPQRQITDEMIYKCRYYSKSAYERALNGDPGCQYSTGLQWSGGDFGVKDKDEALRWYYLAAQQGYADAEMKVADAYEDAHIYGYKLKENAFEAAKWYARAHKHGDKNASFYLGLLLDSREITNEEFRIANELANNDVQSTKTQAIAAYKKFFSSRADSDR